MLEVGIGTVFSTTTTPFTIYVFIYNILYKESFEMNLLVDI